MVIGLNENIVGANFGAFPSFRRDRVESHKSMGFHGGGFTLIELLVVLAIVALLVSIALPRYFNKVERAKETVLIENLHIVRKTIDDFYGDKGRYPDSLNELITESYLHSLPMDPVTESTSTWLITSPLPPALGNVADIHSGAEGNDLDGVSFSSL